MEMITAANVLARVHDADSFDDTFLICSIILLSWQGSGFLANGVGRVANGISRVANTASGAAQE